jgi:hypothetical protein
MARYQIVFVSELRAGETLASCDSISAVFLVEAESLERAEEKARERMHREGCGVYETYDELATRCALLET